MMERMAEGTSVPMKPSTEFTWPPCAVINQNKKIARHTITRTPTRNTEYMKNMQCFERSWWPHMWIRTARKTTILKNVETTIATIATIWTGLPLSTKMVTGTIEEAIDWSQAMMNHSASARATRECNRPPGVLQQQKQQQQHNEQQWPMHLGTAIPPRFDLSIATISSTVISRRRRSRHGIDAYKKMWSKRITNAKLYTMKIKAKGAPMMAEDQNRLNVAELAFGFIISEGTNTTSTTPTTMLRMMWNVRQVEKKGTSSCTEHGVYLQGT